MSITDEARAELVDVREHYAYGCGPEHTWPTSRTDFDRWLEAHDKETAVRVLTAARHYITPYLATAERWRYDQVIWAFAMMLKEIPEDTPEPVQPSQRVALTST